MASRGSDASGSFARNMNLFCVIKKGATRGVAPSALWSTAKSVEEACYHSKGLGCWELAGEALELYVTVHIEHIAAARNVVEQRHTRRVSRIRVGAHRIPHDRNHALGFCATGGIINVRNQEALNTFLEPKQLVPTIVARSVEGRCECQVIVSNDVIRIVVIIHKRINSDQPTSWEGAKVPDGKPIPSNPMSNIGLVSSTRSNTHPK